MDAELDDLVGLCLAMLEARPAGLLTDIDGTISLIAPTPDAASVDDDVHRALRMLVRMLDVVGVVTGRAADDAERLVAVPGLLYVGNHGLEQRRHGLTQIHPDAVLGIGAVAETLRSVRRDADLAGITDGILYENKGATASIHYRLAPDPEHAHAALLPLVLAEAEAHGLRVSEGRMVIELRPQVAINKGTAVRGIAEGSGLRSLLFFGDDITDIDGFNAVASMREAGDLRGLNIAVVAPESPPEVAAAADLVIHGVAACTELLCKLSIALQPTARRTEGK